MRYKLPLLFSFLFILPLSSCDSSDKDPKTKMMKATQIARKIMILDSHLDVPHRLNKNPVDLSLLNTQGHFDYPRAIAGGLNVAFLQLLFQHLYR